MNELIKKLLLEGKSDVEIATAVLEAHKDESIEAIKSAIIDAKKLDEVIKGLESDEKAKKVLEDAVKAKDAEAIKVKELVAAELKSININPLGLQFAPPKELKLFNPSTGKIEGVNSDVSEGYGSYNAMLSCIMGDDIQNAKAISKEIDQDNFNHNKAINDHASKKLDSLGIKTANDPLASDTAARGGYAIPTEVDMMIQQLIYAGSVMMSNMNTDNIIYESKIYPLLYGLAVSDIADQDTAVTESQQTFTNPTIAMQRAGLFFNMSNTFMRQKGADLVRAANAAIAGAFATFLDVRLSIGNVTSTGDLVDGIAFDTNTNAPTAVALASLDIDDISALIRTLSENVSNIVMVANRKIVDTVGMFENTGGNQLFPQYINGGSIAPFGVPMIKNPKITSALDIGGDARTGGTDDAILCYDKDYAIAGISGSTRIAFSDQWRFSNDVTTVRAIKEYGSKVLSATGTAGIVASVQELTN